MNAHPVPMQPFSTSFTVRFDEADPAGVSFFANVLKYHHHAYENWVVDRHQCSFAEWFTNPTYAVPVRRSETEHFGPLFPGRRYTLTVALGEVRESSFSLESTVTESGANAAPLAIVRTVHVFIDSRSGHKIGIPDPIRSRLKAK